MSMSVLFKEISSALDLSLVQVRTLVDETDVGKIRAGLSATVTVDAYPNRPFGGTVLKIEPLATVNQNVTMFPVIIRINNGDKLLKTGMNADVQIQVARRENAMVVPNDAVVSTADATSVGQALGLSEEDVQKALDAMAEHQLRRIPVVDDDGQVVGIIAQADVATRVDQPEKTAEMVKEISQDNQK